MNYSIKQNLLKIRGAFSANIQGKTATKPCLCIPYDSPDLYVGDKGIYFDAVAFESRQTMQSGSTHFIKASLSKADREAMTEEQRDALPIIGSLTPMRSQTEAQTAAQAPTPVMPLGDDNDLPF